MAASSASMSSPGSRNLNGWIRTLYRDTVHLYSQWLDNLINVLPGTPLSSPPLSPAVSGPGMCLCESVCQLEYFPRSNSNLKTGMRLLVTTLTNLTHYQ